MDILLLLFDKHPRLMNPSSPVHPIHLVVAENKLQMLRFLLRLSRLKYPNCGLGKFPSLTEVQTQRGDLRFSWYLSSNSYTETMNSGTPLHVATRLQNGSAAPILLDHDAKVDSLDFERRTLLHYSMVLKDDTMVARLLLER